MTDYLSYWRSLSEDLESIDSTTAADTTTEDFYVDTTTAADTTTEDFDVETTPFWSVEYYTEPEWNDASSAGSTAAPDWLLGINMVILVISLGWCFSKLVNQWEEHGAYQEARHPRRRSLDQIDELRGQFHAYVVRDIAHNQEVDNMLNGIQNDQAEIHRHFGLVSDRLETLIAACARRRRREISTSETSLGSTSSGSGSGSGRRLPSHARRAAPLEPFVRR